MVYINLPIEDERHADLTYIQAYYSKQQGAKISKAVTLRRILFDTANEIRAREDKNK